MPLELLPLSRDCDPDADEEDPDPDEDEPLVPDVRDPCAIVPVISTCWPTCCASSDVLP